MRWGERKKGRLLDPRYIFGQDALKRIMDGEELAVEFRLATSEDLEKFVIPKWMESYSRSLPAKFCKADARYAVGREIYWQAQRGKIDRILATPGVKVVVAYMADTHVAFAVENKAARDMHYVYVREPFRRQGIARQMCGWIDNPEGGPVRLTHLPPPWYTKPQPLGQGRIAGSMCAGHICIDLISPE